MENLLERLESEFYEKLSDFAHVKGFTKNGRLLEICGNLYEAWNYDTYIYYAIIIASRWKKHQVTYDRILHMRCWLRENIQHGHGLDFSKIRSVTGLKNRLDELMRREYLDEYWKEQLEFSLKNNEEIFSPQNDKPA